MRFYFMLFVYKTIHHHHHQRWYHEQALVSLQKVGVASSINHLYKKKLNG